jgi:hypothetical protein
VRDYKGAIEWYRENQTTHEIGFNPDGMCLKVCRTARLIAAQHLTAKMSQDATPKEHRVHKVADLRKGMVLYFDDPNDSNTAGHIVTMIGRVKGFDPDSLHDILVETNSVKSGELVVVRGDYFQEHWNDKFQFGATWLNGHVLDVFTKKAKPPVGQARLENFSGTRPDWDVKILDRVGEKLPDIRRKVKEIDNIVDDLPDDNKDERLEDFKQAYEKNRILKVHLLTDMVREKPQATRVKAGRDKLQAIIKSVLPRS